MIRLIRTPLALLLLLPACAPKRAEIPLDATAIEAKELIRLVQERSDRVRSLEGTGTISFESPRVGGTAAFELSLKKPDSLLVLLEGPFGIDVGMLFLSREEYLAYNPQENVVISGVPGSGTLQSVLPLDLTFDQLINAFSGTIDAPDPGAQVRRYGVADDRFLVVNDCGGLTCSYWIDHLYLQVSRFEAHRDGKLVMQVVSSSFTEHDGASVPRRITVWLPEEERQVSVQYRSVTINPDRPSFAYSFPSDARIVKP